MNPIGRRFTSLSQGSGKSVRGETEFNGPLGRIPGARLIPLAQLPDRAGELAKEKPIVAVCRAGGRSAQATVLLGKAGYKKVGNLPGGMLRWRALGLATEGAGDDVQRP
jgi:rhodanese-related sulfurtransferase